MPISLKDTLASNLLDTKNQFCNLNDFWNDNVIIPQSDTIKGLVICN